MSCDFFALSFEEIKTICRVFKDALCQKEQAHARHYCRGASRVGMKNVEDRLAG